MLRLCNIPFSGGHFPLMRAARRRSRESDPLASPEAARTICRLLRERMPDTIPSSEKQLTHFLFAVRHVERRPATDTRRGPTEPLATRKAAGGYHSTARHT